MKAYTDYQKDKLIGFMKHKIGFNLGPQMMKAVKIVQPPVCRYTLHELVL